MSRYVNLSLIPFVSVFCFGLLSAQERVLETRLLVKTKGGAEGSLGSKLFVYSGRNLFRLEGDQEVPVPVLKRPLKVSDGKVGVGENIYGAQVSRDDSRIVFGSGGPTWHYPMAIHSVRPDGSQLRTLVQSGDGCGKFIWPGYGTNLCSFPRRPRLSPDGQKVVFFNEVYEWDEEAKANHRHIYLSMVPVTGGPIVRLTEARGGNLVWSEDSTSIYYYYYYIPHRYDLETGRSEPLTDESWKVRGKPLAVSRADGSLYFNSIQGFTRLDPETGLAEVISEEVFESFDLSPDGRRAVGLKEGDLTIVDLEFPSTSPLQVAPGTADALQLSQIPAAREKWVGQKMQRATSYSTLRKLSSQARKATGVKRVRWLDNERLWCVVQEDTDAMTTSGREVRIGIAQLQ